MTLPIHTLDRGKPIRLRENMTVVRIAGEVIWLCEHCGSPAFIANAERIVCRDCEHIEPIEELNP